MNLEGGFLYYYATQWVSKISPLMYTFLLGLLHHIPVVHVSGITFAYLATVLYAQAGQNLF